MILDSGLDNACTGGYTNTGARWFTEFLRFAAIGTGSTPATPSDLLLEAQVGSRSSNDGGFSNNNDGALDSGNNLIILEQEYTRVFNITSSVVIREWGLAPANTGNLSARDLFRDLSNNPTALPLEDGDQLQLVIRLTVQAAWEYQPASFIITGTDGNDMNGTHDGQATVSPGAGTTVTSIHDALLACWPGNTLTSGNSAPALTVCHAPQTAAKNQNLTGTRVRTVCGLQTYVPGTFYRDHVATFGTSAANGDHHAWLAGPNTNNANEGYRFLLTDPQFLTKTDTERLVLTVRKHVARA